MMTRNILLSCIGVFVAMIWLISCEHKSFPTPTSTVDSFGNYPPEIGRIFIKKCAEGCHDQTHYTANAGLLMDTWDHLFNGANNGAVVVPFSPEYSSLMYFINTDSTRGISLKPTMPYNLNPPFNRPPLSEDEYNTIRNWIAKGAPDRFGNIPFATNAESRQKVYMSMQGCGLVGVIDAERNVIMRYIKVKGSEDDFGPHAVRTSGDGQYAYVCFSQKGHNVVKINTTTDQVVARMRLLVGEAWNAFHVSDDGSQLILANTTGSGSLRIVNTVTGQDAPFMEGLAMPHGVVSNKAFDTFYVTLQYGNVVLRIYNEGANVDTVSLDGKPPFQRDTSASSATTPDPHEIAMSPDQKKLLVTCQGTHQVKVIDVATFKVTGTVEVGAVPLEMALSPSKPYVYVTCSEAQSMIGPIYKGNVYIVDYSTMSRVGMIEGKFSQPHGIALDEQKGLIWVGNRNVNPSGPAPHHTSDCGNGRNGFFQAYFLDTRQPASVKHEVTPDPYGCDIRFKR